MAIQREGAPVQERRRSERHAIAVRVLLRGSSGAHQLYTTDVSRHGLFLATDSPRAERELVQLQLELPGHGTLDVMGMVARVPSERQGMGVSFFALSRAAKDTWDRFVHGLPLHPDEPDSPDVPPQSTRRAHPRVMACFLVQLRDRARLREFYTRDVSAGGLFLRTPAPDKVSPVVDLIVVHPESKEEFPIQGEVVRVEMDGPVAQRGVGVQFRKLDRERQRALLVFIESGANYLERSSDSHRAFVDDLTAAAQRVGDATEALHILAEALLEEQAAGEAEQVYRKLTRLEPQGLPACRGLYKALVMQGQQEAAAEQLVRLRRMERLQRP